MHVTMVDRASVIAALGSQAARLEALERELEQQRARLPAADGVWRGPAHDAFAGGIRLLQREFGALLADVGSAAAATRRAVGAVVAGG